MLYPLFVIGCLWWWLGVVVISALLICALEKESGFWATVLCIAFVGSTLSLGTNEALMGIDWLPHTLPEIALTALAYVGIGTAWGFAKWYLYVADRLNGYRVIRQYWLKVNNLASIPPERKQEWLQWLYDRRSTWVKWEYATDPVSHTDRSQVYTLTLKPLANDNKSRIATWMSYWPWSMLWTLCADLVKRVFKSIQKLCSNAMDRMATWIFRDFKED